MCMLLFPLGFFGRYVVFSLPRLSYLTYCYLAYALVFLCLVACVQTPPATPPPPPKKNNSGRYFFGGEGDVCTQACVYQNPLVCVTIFCYCFSKSGNYSAFYICFMIHCLCCRFEQNPKGFLL